MQRATTKRATIVKTLALASVCGMAIWISPTPASARIKLATLPAKSNLTLRFDHPQLVFVEEERVIALQQGENTIDFSWAGTTIDKASIVFRPADAASPVLVLSTSYPPGENALTWAVSSPAPRSEAFRVSYLMGSISRETSFDLLINKAETIGTLKHSFKIVNGSGEDFDDANFVLPGGQSIKNSVDYGEAKQVLLHAYKDIPLRKEYVFDLARASDAVQTDFVFKNSADQQLGRQPFDAGKVRMYQMNEKGERTFLGEDWGKFTAIGDELRLYVGVAQDVKVERKVWQDKHENVRGNVYDVDAIIRYELKNFKDKAVKVKIVERVDGEWEFKEDSTTGPIAKRVSNEEVHFEVVVEPTKDPTKPQTADFHFMHKNVW